MIKQVVRDYEVVVDMMKPARAFHGDSAAAKSIVFHLFQDNSKPRSVLDIGFGMGGLGRLIRRHPETAAWVVDGVDGCDANCRNQELFDERLYRNIWHGLAQELGSQQLASYDVICLLDVIEHLDVATSKEVLRSLLASLRDDAILVLSTPLWFYPQDSKDEGDLEEHLIGVPATSIMALQPIMYTISFPLVGTFALRKSSLSNIDQFMPTADRSFDIQRGTELALQLNMKLDQNVLYIMKYDV